MDDVSVKNIEALLQTAKEVGQSKEFMDLCESLSIKA
jgi:hypothetical protein